MTQKTTPKKLTKSAGTTALNNIGIKVNNYEEFISALKTPGVTIEISSSFFCPNTVILPEAVRLLGAVMPDNSNPTISFYGSDGIGLTANNGIHSINIDTSENKRAIYLASSIGDLGRFTFGDLTLRGQFSFITDSNFKTAIFTIDGVHIVTADTRGYLEQPNKYNVNVLQGAFTVYNRNPDKNSDIQFSIRDISIGLRNAPVTGSGIFVSGYGDTGGTVTVANLHTMHVYSNSKIPSGVSNLIAAAVFISTGANVTDLSTGGEVSTSGTNDMVIDVWGSVENITAIKPLISYGPSSIGFVNFGTVKKFIAKSEIKTYGLGSRGYNQYDGSLGEGHFQTIETYGDGAVGIQISKKVGKIVLNKTLITHGSVGSSLVKGQIMQLPANALSIIEGGEVGEILAKWDIETTGDNVTTYSIDMGIVKKFTIKGKIIASGSNSKKTSERQKAAVIVPK